MAVYRHFESKEDLLRAVGEGAFAAFQQRIFGLPEAPIETWLRSVSREYAQFALDDPGQFEACFVLRTHAERIYPQDFRAGKSPVISLIAKKLEEAQASGQLGSGDALELAMLFWAQIHGLVMLHRSGRFSLNRNEFLALCDRAGRLITGGLIQPPAPRAHTSKKRVGRRLR